MGNKIYFSQIKAKIDRLQRERTQVLEHLELVERKIQKLNPTIISRLMKSPRLS